MAAKVRANGPSGYLSLVALSTSWRGVLRLSALVFTAVLFACSEEAAKPVQVEQLAETQKPKPPPPPPPELPADDSAVVVSVLGKVEIRRGDRPSWDEAKVGDHVAANDSVRTSEESNMEMQVGEAKLVLKEQTDVKVKSVGKGKLRARVTGHMEAKVTEGSDATVELEAEGSDTVLTTKGGEVAMIADGQGVVAVASKDGVASLRVGDQETELKPGETGRIVDDKLEREALTELLFKVNWPGAKETKSATVPLEGRAPVGSRVLVAGQLVKVDKKGRFKTKVKLKEGRQKIAVVVKDVSGRTREQTQEITRDSHNHLGVDRVQWGN